MKCSLGISNFLEEISSLCHYVVFLAGGAQVACGKMQNGGGVKRDITFHLITKKLGLLFRTLLHCQLMNTQQGFLNGSECKKSTCNAGDVGDVGSILGLGRSLGGGHSNPLQYSCWENPMDRSAWWAMVLGVAKDQRTLK